MPKIPAKFEDWTPPWKEGEIDEAVVARLVYNLQLSEQELTAEKKTLKSANEELTSANEVYKVASEAAKNEHSTEVQQAVAAAEKERDQAREELSTQKRENDLLQVRVKYPKIDDDDIERLKGKDLDELLDDAKAFAEKHNLVDDGSGPDDDDPHDDGDLRRQPRLRRSGLDPEPRSGGNDDLEGFLQKRAAAGPFG